MVQKHRSASHATSAKDVSPMRNMVIRKQTLASSPNTNTASSFGGRLSLPTAAATSSINMDKWKYNNMVNNDRDQFNNLHFC